METYRIGYFILVFIRIFILLYCFDLGLNMITHMQVIVTVTVNHVSTYDLYHIYTINRYVCRTLSLEYNK